MGGAVLRACAGAFPVRAAMRDPKRHGGPGEAVAFDMETPSTFGAALVLADAGRCRIEAPISRSAIERAAA